jgi:hypothetical protein
MGRARIGLNAVLIGGGLLLSAFLWLAAAGNSPGFLPFHAAAARPAEVTLARALPPEHKAKAPKRIRRARAGATAPVVAVPASSVVAVSTSAPARPAARRHAPSHRPTSPSAATHPPTATPPPPPPPPPPVVGPGNPVAAAPSSTSGSNSALAGSPTATPPPPPPGNFQQPSVQKPATPPPPPPVTTPPPAATPPAAPPPPPSEKPHKGHGPK